MQQIRTKYFMNRPITSCDRNGANIPPKSAQNAPKLRRTIRRGDRNREPNPLTGLLYCGECGAKMYNERSDGDAYHKTPTDNYVCASYRKKTTSCTIHFIRTEIVRDLILDALLQKLYEDYALGRLPEKRHAKLSAPS